MQSLKNHVVVNLKQSKLNKIIIRYPRFFAECGITKLNAFNTKILCILLSMLSFENHNPNDRAFIITPEQYKMFFQEKETKDNTLYKRFSRNMKELREFQYSEDFENWYDVFEYAEVKNASMYIAFTKEFIEKYLKGISLTGSESPTIFRLNLVDLLAPYELRLYLLLRNFVVKKQRFKEKNEFKFMHRLGYVMDLKYFSSFKRYVLVEGIKNINDKTDITASYRIDKDKKKGVRKISFNIKFKEKKKIVETTADVWNNL